jgi:hypothetical protein
LSTTEVAELVEFAEARAWSSFYRSAPTATADALGIRVVTFGPTTALAMAGAPFPLVNRVIGLGVGAPATEGVVDELLDVYGGIGVKDFAVQIAESAGPSELARWLDERNLVAGGAWAKAYRGNGPVSALQGPARVERASQLDVDAFGDVATRGFEMPEDFGPLFGGLVGKPDWHTYLADERRKGRRRDEFDGAGCAGSISTVPPRPRSTPSTRRRFVRGSTRRVWDEHGAVGS